MKIADKITQLLKDAGVSIASEPVKEVIAKLTELDYELTGEALTGFNKFTTTELAKKDPQLRNELRAEALDGIDKHLELKLAKVMTADELAKWKNDNPKSQQKVDAYEAYLLSKQKPAALPADEDKRIQTLIEEARKDVLAELGMTKKELAEYQKAKADLESQYNKLKGDLSVTQKNQLYTEFLAKYQFALPKGLDYAKTEIDNFLSENNATVARRNGEYILVSNDNPDVQVRDANNMPINFVSVAEKLMETGGLLKKSEATATAPATVNATGTSGGNNYNLSQAARIRAEMGLK